MYGGSLPTIFCLFSIPLTFTETADWQQSSEVAHWWICFVSTCNFVLLLSQFLYWSVLHVLEQLWNHLTFSVFMVGKNCKCRGTGETEGWAQARWIHIHSCVIATSGCSCRNECLCNICSCLEVEITFLVSRAVLLTCWLQLITQIHNCSFSHTGTSQVHTVYKIRTWRAVWCVMSSVPYPLNTDTTCTVWWQSL